VATRAPRPTRFSRKATTVDIAQARIEAGRRLERGTEHGKPFLRVVIPTPREPKPEQVIDLSFLSVLPNLADALAEAFFGLDSHHAKDREPWRRGGASSRGIGGLPR
jgi:hypothetical protein